MKFKRTTWPKLLTLSQAATSLGLSAGTLRIQVSRGRLQATKVSRDWMVEEEEVERYRREILGKSGVRKSAA